MMQRVLVTACLFLLAVVAVSCASHLQRGGPARKALLNDLAIAAVNAQATFPPGPRGDLIRFGHDLMAQTPRYAGQYITAQMSCAACHVADGRQAHTGSLLGSYARFPQWNKRAHRFIALQDRIAECFLYSMNGTPPAYYSREMVAITAYIAWLSRGARTGKGFPNQEPVALQTGLSPDPHAGGQIYAARCSKCHSVDGSGSGLLYPPLWGAKSFNDRAGMSRMDRIAPFVRAAMPRDAPGTLTDQQALDVAAFILTKPRPHFDKSKLVRFPAEPAGYF